MLAYYSVFRLNSMQNIKLWYLVQRVFFKWINNWTARKMYRLHPCATVGNPLVSETDGVVFVFSLLLRFLFFVCLLVSWWFSSVAPPPKPGFQILHNCLMTQAVCKLRDRVTWQQGMVRDSCLMAITRTEPLLVSMPHIKSRWAIRILKQTFPWSLTCGNKAARLACVQNC